MKQHMEYPATDKISLCTDLNFSTRNGFKPNIGLIDYENSYTVSLMSENIIKRNSSCLTKELKLKILSDSIYLGFLPIKCRYSVIYGNRFDYIKKNCFQSYNLFFTRDDIKLSPFLIWTSGLDIQYFKDSSNFSGTCNYKIKTSLNKIWSPRFKTSLTYNCIGNKKFFNFNGVEIKQNIINKASFQIDKMNKLSMESKYNCISHKYSIVNYKFEHNMHCWQFGISYSTKQDMHWKFNISTKQF